MRIVGATAVVAAASVAEGAAAFAVGVVVARAGGAAALGRLAVASALLLAALTVTEMGQNVVLTRRAAARRGVREGLGASLLSKALLSAAAALAIVACWPAAEPAQGAVAAALLLVLSNLTISLTAVLRGRERFAAAAGASWAGALVTAAGIAALMPSSLAAVFTLLAAAQAVKGLVAWAALPADVLPAWPRARDLRALGAETLPFAGVVLLGMAYFKADVLMVSGLAGAAEAGSYAAAVRVIEALKIAPAALAAAVFPALAGGQGRALSRALVLAACGGGVAFVVLAVSAEWLMPAVFGPDLASSVPPLRLLSLAFVLSAMGGVLNVALYARRAEGAALGALAAALATSVLANLWLTPARGAAGAALAAIVSEAVLVALLARALRLSHAPLAGIPSLAPATADGHP